MKKIVLYCLLAVMGCSFAAVEASAARPKETATVVFCTDIDCEGCAQKILTNVPTLGRGIEDIQVDVPSKEVTIVYDTARTSPERLIEGLAKLRVKAEVKEIRMSSCVVSPDGSIRHVTR